VGLRSAPQAEPSRPVKLGEPAGAAAAALGAADAAERAEAASGEAGAACEKAGARLDLLEARVAECTEVLRARAAAPEPPPPPPTEPTAAAWAAISAGGAMAMALQLLGAGRESYFTQDGQPVAAAEWCGKLLSGLHAAIFLSGDPDYWHERILLWPASADLPPRRWFVATPDGDVYAEPIRAGMGWGSRVVILDSSASNAVIPAGTRYAFEPLPSDGDLAQYVTEAIEEAALDGFRIASQDELKYLRRDGQEVLLGDLVPPPPPLQAADLLADVPPSDHGVPPALGDTAQPVQGTGTPRGRHVPEHGRVWVSLETVPGQIARDDEVKLSESALIDDDRAIHVLPSGKRIAARLADLPVEPLLNESELGDARTLGPLRYDSHGQRHLDYRTGVLELREEALDAFPLKGERSFSWLQRHITEHGGTPDGRRTKYLTEESLQPDNTAGHLHDLPGLSMFWSAVYDQVDGSNLACMEVVARCYQLVGEAKGPMRTEGLEYYTGRDQGGATRRGIAAAPGLARHATDTLSKEVEIAKQRRKFRGEQAAKRGEGSHNNSKHKGKDKDKPNKDSSPTG
ncbi:unnamed protein product, partial [Prorocentrum cordatum]